MSSSPMTARLDAAIDEAINEGSIVGTVVLVSQDGQARYARAAGWADREAEIAMRQDSIFRLASVTKPIVSVAAMRLVELGILQLDAPVTHYLPFFRPRLGDGSEPVITVHNLLSHTSGLSYGFLMNPGSDYDQRSVSDGLDAPGWGLTENLARLATAPLLFPPGERWCYSLALDVLGAVIESATQQNLASVVAKYVTQPLAMSDTGFSVTDESRLVKPYMDAAPAPVEMHDGAEVPLEGPDFQGKIRFSPSRILDPTSYPSGGAGMAGSAQDVLRLIEAIQLGGNNVLSEATVNQMLRDQVGPGAQTNGPGWGFGYGWAVLSDSSEAEGPQAQGTIQWGGVYGHTWFMDPINKLSVVALTNTALSGLYGSFPTNVRNAIYG